ncbi:uncharacterized protein [Oscarella lobularis]|uniref:uncharacterized protein n=1 Tax=Oscarella lobularis TaxID=121494 RepID=UPI00331326F4
MSDFLLRLVICNVVLGSTCSIAVTPYQAIQWERCSDGTFCHRGYRCCSRSDGEKCCLDKPSPASPTTGWQWWQWFLVGFGVFLAMSALSACILICLCHGESNNDNVERLSSKEDKKEPEPTETVVEFMSMSEAPAANSEVVQSNGTVA